MTYRTTVAALLFGVAVLLPAAATSQHRYGLTDNEYRAVEEARRFFNDMPASDRGHVELPETDELIRCMLSEGAPCRRDPSQRVLEQFFQGLQEGIEARNRRDVANGATVVGYGSREGESVRIVEATGTDTSSASIAVEFSHEQLRLHCDYYLGDESGACPTRVREDLHERGFVPRVSGNCRIGAFHDFFGTSYRFEGRQDASETATPFRIRDVDRGEILGPSMSSNYSVAVDVFEALCPAVFRGNSR